MSNNKHFAYFPIDTAKQELRLLLLGAREAEDEPVSAVLIQADVASAPPYKALSYTWDAAPPARRIIINGETFFVRRNLEKALKQFTSRTEEVCLWIDAICINQNDLGERSRHVTYMHRVYEQAEEVLVWLGDSADDSDFLLTHLNDFYLDLSQHQQAGRISTAHDTPSHDKMPYWTSLFNSGRFVRALSKFLSRRWWRRMWTMQEFVCAMELSLFCGSQKMSKEVLYLAKSIAANQTANPLLSAFQAANVAVYTQISLLQEFHALRQASTPIDLEDTLKLVRVREATDPRDKIYAVLNICTDQKQAIRPDYETSPADVFADLARYLIETTKSLNILGSCEYFVFPTRQDHLRQSSQMQSVLGLPTWVPDWARARLSVPLLRRDQGGPSAANKSTTVSDEYYHADGNAETFYEFDGRRLIVQGFVYDDVAAVCPFWLGSEPSAIAQGSSPILYRNILTWFSVQILDESCNGIDRAYLLSSMICGVASPVTAAATTDDGDDDNDGVDNNDTGDTAQIQSNIRSEVETCFKQWLGLGGDKTSMQGIDTFVRIAISMLNFRRLIITKRGRPAIVPAGVNLRDQICVFSGASVPFVVRNSHSLYVRDNDKCKIHSMISDCRHHGCYKDKMMVDPQRSNTLFGECCEYTCY